MNVQYRVSPENLKSFVSDLFAGYGFQPAHADSIAGNLVGADMRGLRSHGVVRVELYLTQQAVGGISTDTNPEIVFETPVTAVVEANKVAGAVAGDFATELAAQKAKKMGFGMVTVRNSNHFGGCGYFTEKLAKQGMLGFAASNTAPLMASPVTKKAVIGNNPFSVAMPAGKYAPFNLDISNGVMAFGKIHEYRRLNKPFPENAWLDENGNPTTDPFANDFIKFISLPIAAHKGYGLALMVELVTSVLAGGVVAGDMLPKEGHSQDENNPVSHTILAIDLDYFGNKEEIIARSEALVDYLHSFETRSPDQKMLYPGEMEGAAISKSEEEGIDVPENIINYLKNKADEIHMRFPEEHFTRVER